MGEAFICSPSLSKNTGTMQNLNVFACLDHQTRKVLEPGLFPLWLVPKPLLGWCRMGILPHPSAQLDQAAADAASWHLMGRAGASHPRAAPGAALENLPWFAAKFSISAWPHFLRMFGGERRRNTVLQDSGRCSGTAVLVMVLLVSRAPLQPSCT